MNIPGRLLLILSALLPLSLGACQDDARNEAQLFLERYSGLDAASMGERDRRVQALLAMPLRIEEVKDVRDTCGAMHRATLTAEQTSLELQRLIDGNERPSPEEVEPLFARSEEATAEARELLPACTEKLAALRQRYAPER